MITLLFSTQKEKYDLLDLLGSTSVLISSKTTFLPILSVKESNCFTIVAFKSSLCLFLTVTTALTLKFTAFSGTVVLLLVLIISSLIAATGALTALFNCSCLLICCEGTKTGLPKNWFLLTIPTLWFVNIFDVGKNDDPSIKRPPMISVASAILFLSLFFSLQRLYASAEMRENGCRRPRKRRSVREQWMRWRSVKTAFYFSLMNLYVPLCDLIYTCVTSYEARTKMMCPIKHFSPSTRFSNYLILLF